jgi:Fe-S cluster assembly protein SufD
VPPTLERTELFTPGDGGDGSSVPPVVQRLGGPDWLQARRADAATVAADFALPSVEAEEWRYSRIAQLDLSRYRLRHDIAGPGAADTDPTGTPRPPVPPVVGELLSGLGPVAGVVVLVDGRIVHSEAAGGPWDAGVRFGSAHDDAIDAEEVLGSAMEEPLDLFAAYNDALSEEPVVLDVPRGVTVADPFVVVSYLSADGVAVLPRLSVRAGEDSEVSVIEVNLSDDVDSLVAPVTEVSVGQAARVRYAALQDLGRRVWQLGSFVAEVERDATLSAGVAAIGGDYARLRLDCRLVGRGATGNLSSAYFGDGDQMLDLRTFQEHRAQDTTSNLLFKGAVADSSHSVYTGLIRIRPDARGSNAFQTNRNLKLSEHAWAESVPNLEIENNDVRCSHASTVGPVDADQRFYLESRGVPTSVAERLIVGGFFDEVLDDLPVPALAPAVRERLDALLDRSVGGAS